MHATQQAGETQTPSPQEEVEVLWTERRSKLCDGYVWSLLGCNIPLLFVYGMLTLSCTEPGGMLPEESRYLLFFPVLSALSLLLIICHVLGNYRTVYILTRSHAHIVIRYPLVGRKTYSTSITRHMVFEVKRRQDGSADYMLMQHRVGELTIPAGFIGVKNVAELERQLKQCGVQLPSSAHATSAPPPSTKKLVILSLLPLLILGVTTHRMQNSDALRLDVMGQPAIATVAGYCVQAKKEGRKRRSSRAVTRYYPILQFQTAEGTPTQAIDRLGDKRPQHELREQVDIIYLPHNPSVAKRASRLRYVEPGLILLFFLGSLTALGINLHRLYRHRTAHPTT